MSFIEDALATLGEHRFAIPAVQFLLLAFAVLLTYMVAKAVLVRFIGRVVRLTPARWDDALLGKGVISRLAQVVPALVVYYGSVYLPAVPDGAMPIIRRVANVYLIGAVIAAIMALLDAISEIYEQYNPERARIKPIKSYLQLTKIIACFIAGVFIAAALFDRDPLLILSGLGALTAVLMLIFKDTIQSFVAGVQIATHDMLRIGDWIEMPEVHADGEAIDMSLHTVKIQNADLSVTTIPTWRLISDSFRNWRAMHEAGARLVQRAVLLDQTSIRFLDPAEWEQLRRSRLVDEQLGRRPAELITSSGGVPVNVHRATNAGVFRAYVRGYLHVHPSVRQDLNIRVRLLMPTPTGLPLEIQCFTPTNLEEFESTQAEIVEHLVSVMPEFGLRSFQQPSGTGGARKLPARRSA